MGGIAIYWRGKTADLCTRKLNLLIMKAMMTKLKSLFVAFLTIAASAQKLGINLIRVAILVIFCMDWRSEILEL